MTNPYKPQSLTSKKRVGQVWETRNYRDELVDWSILFVVTILFLILFHHVLIDFFIDIFRNILYND